MMQAPGKQSRQNEAQHAKNKVGGEIEGAPGLVPWRGAREGVATVSCEGSEPAKLRTQDSAESESRAPAHFQSSRLRSSVFQVQHRARCSGTSLMLTLKLADSDTSVET